MLGFNEREKAHERKFAHEEEMKFKVRSLNMRLLGEWAAEKLGKSGEGAQQYAKGITLFDFESRNEKSTYAKVVVDLVQAGQLVSEDEVMRQSEHLYAKAYAQVAGLH